MKSGQKTWTHISPKKICRWQINIWKGRWGKGRLGETVFLLTAQSLAWCFLSPPTWLPLARYQVLPLRPPLTSALWLSLWLQCRTAFPTHPVPGGTPWAGPWWLVGTRPVMYQEQRGAENGHFLPTPGPRCGPAVAHWYADGPLSVHHYESLVEILCETFHLPHSYVLYESNSNDILGKEKLWTQ